MYHEDLIEDVLAEMTKTFNLNETEVLVAKVAMQGLVMKINLDK